MSNKVKGDLDHYTSRGKELMRDIKQTTTRELPPFNTKSLTTLKCQMTNLHNMNMEDTAKIQGQENHSLLPVVRVRHAIIERDKRVGLSYVYNRLAKLRRARWRYGATLPDFINDNASEPEKQYFLNYSRLLTNYMKTIGEDGLDLTDDHKPIKALMVQVKVIKDWELTLDDGDIIKMLVGTIHTMPQDKFEQLFKLGVVQIYKPEPPKPCTKY